MPTVLSHYTSARHTTVPFNNATMQSNSWIYRHASFKSVFQLIHHGGTVIRDNLYFTSNSVETQKSVRGDPILKQASKIKSEY